MREKEESLELLVRDGWLVEMPDMCGFFGLGVSIHRVIIHPLSFYTETMITTTMVKRDSTMISKTLSVAQKSHDGTDTAFEDGIILLQPCLFTRDLK